MAPRQVVFIHHSQRGGRISHDNATKAWAYVSRRSWQEKPKQLTIKMWEPQENVLDQDEICHSDDQNMIGVAYSTHDTNACRISPRPVVVDPASELHSTQHLTTTLVVEADKPEKLAVARRRPTPQTAVPSVLHHLATPTPKAVRFCKPTDLIPRLKSLIMIVVQIGK